MMTAKEWDEHRLSHIRALKREHPGWTTDRVIHEATRQTTQIHGPRPLSWQRALLKVVKQYVKTGGQMDFSWSKNLWKGVKGALASSVTIALIFGADVFIQAFDTPAELTALGVPVWVIPLVMAGVAMVRNFIKHRQRRIPVP